MDSQRLLNIARQQAQKKGLMSLTVGGICDAANIPVGSFQYVARMKFGELIETLRGSVPDHVDGVTYDRRALGNLRRSQMVAAGLKLSHELGYDRVTGSMIAEVVGLSKSSVMQRFGTMAELRNCVMREAVRTGDAAVVAQGLAALDPIAKDAPAAIKEKALQHLANL